MVQHDSVKIPVAVRLAGGGDSDDATAGKPDCYRVKQTPISS
jgi:hypothetical protein